MLVAERHQKIIEIINENKSMKVTELSGIFSVTEETIRRDLEKLEKDNKIYRTHGGAVSLNRSEESEVSYSEREITNIPEKKEIADRKSTRLNSSHVSISYSVFCLKHIK